MPDMQTELALIDAAQTHFDNIPVPDVRVDDPEDRDSLMYQYSIARESVAFFTKQRDKLLAQLLEYGDLPERVDKLIEHVRKTDMGTETLLESANIYNLHLKLSAPPQQFDKSVIPGALSDIFEATPTQVRRTIDYCTTPGTPRKTFTVHQKEMME